MDAINSTKTVTEKIVKTDVCIIGEIKNDVQSVSRCSSSSQLADCLKKAGASSEKLL